LRRACVLFRCRARAANKNGSTARCIFCDCRRLVRPSNLDDANVGVTHVDLIVGYDPAALQWLWKALRFPQFSYKGNPGNRWAGHSINSDLESCIAGQLHVFFPLGVAGKAGFTVSGITRRRGSPFPSSADGEALDQLSV